MYFRINRSLLCLLTIKRNIDIYKISKEKQVCSCCVFLEKHQKFKSWFNIKCANLETSKGTTGYKWRKYLNKLCIHLGKNNSEGEAHQEHKS